MLNHSKPLRQRHGLSTAGFRFKWPLVTDGVVRLSALQLSVLLSGLPWERLQAPPIFRPRAAC